MATILKYKTKKGNRYRVRYLFSGIQKSKSFPTLKMAKVYQIRVEHEKLSGVYVPTHKMNVDELLNEWLEFHSEKVRATTLQSYIQTVKVIKSYIGKDQIQTITPTEIEAMYLKHSKNHSERTVYYLHQVLRMAFKYAMKSRLVQVNPIDMVDVPSHGKSQVETISYSDIPRYLDAVKDSWVYPAVLLAIFCGMRRGEIYSLKWSKIDFNKKTILIDEVENIVNYITIVTTPKNKEIRTIPIPEVVLGVLSEYRNLHPKSEYVVLKEDGNRPLPRSIRQAFQRRCIQAGLSKVSFHSLKHTAATLMEYSGVAPKVSSSILAHKSVAFTDKVYKYVFDEQFVAARNALDTHIINNFNL